MNLYISDTYFGHRNVINFDKRQFADIVQMNRILITLWNDKIQPDDAYYIM